MQRPGAAEGARPRSRIMSMGAADRAAKRASNRLSSYIEQPTGIPDLSLVPVKFDQIVPLFTSEHVRSYCDGLIQEHLRAGGRMEEGPVPELRPTEQEAFAAVVMVDVSGYSKLSAYLAEEGPEGSHKLTCIMKDYLDKIIGTIVKNGADIVKFVGDALIFYWKIVGPVDYADISEDANRGELVVNAAFCCMDLLKDNGIHKINLPHCAIKELKIHLGIGAGKIYDIHVGGEVTGRWEHLIAGEAVNQLSQVLDEAKSGELAMSHQCLKFFSQVMDINSVTIGDYGKRCVILHGLERARRKLPPGTPVERNPYSFLGSTPPVYLEMYKKFVDQSALFKIQADINQSHLFQQASGVAHLLNLYELRQVTTVFIKIDSLQMLETNDFLELAQRAFQIVQGSLSKCEGTLRQFHVDDKGAVMLGFFGLPPRAHENDAVLGIKAALDIQDKLKQVFEHFSIGVTTGVVSFGGLGGIIRAEYAVMGDSINMAARIMCLPGAKRSCLCDEQTFNQCSNENTFEDMGMAKVKGKAHPIRIFRPTGSVDKSIYAHKNSPKSATPTMIGRERERRVIRGLISKMQGAEEAGIVTLEAEGGLGLSTLVDFTKTEIASSSECFLL